jgi:hypothetical protein
MEEVLAGDGTAGLDAFGQPHLSHVTPRRSSRLYGPSWGSSTWGSSQD